jgi:hypothetical protein
MSERNLVTAHQANFLPYLGFFEKISVADLFILVDDTQFVKRGPFGWIHRNKILTLKDPIWLTVPVKTHNAYHQLISQTQIADDPSWIRKHIRSIEFAYKKAPHFEKYIEEIKAIYQCKTSHLLDLSQAFIEWCLEILSIKIPMMLSSTLDIKGKGNDYVLELSQKSKATHYISGKHGADYLEPTTFEQNNIGLVFQDFECKPYPQIHSKEFVPYMSILDALFNIGTEGTKELLKSGSNYTVPT